MLLFEFLAVGTWIFWGLVALSAILMSELIDNARGARATLVAVVTLVVLSVLGDFNPLPWILANPGMAVLLVLGYFAVGAVWSVFKWYFYLVRLRRGVEQFRASNPHITDPNDLARRLASQGLPYDEAPQVRDYRGRILGWMMVWPGSVVWTLLNDPVKWTFEWILDHMGGLMQRISDRVFRNMGGPNSTDRGPE